MLIVDSHLDLAWNALQWNRDLLLDAHVLRTREARMTGESRAQNTVTFPEMLRGRIALCFGTALARVNEQGTPTLDYGSPAQAYAAARGHLAYYEALAEQGTTRLISDGTALGKHIAEWAAWDAWTETDESGKTPSDPGSSPLPAPPLGLVFSMECADPILSVAQLERWAEMGLRILGPAHYGRGRYVGGTGTDLGFNEEGKQLLREMERVNMILDVTHLTDKAFSQALVLFNGTVLASHHNCRALVPHQRQLTDDQIRALVKRGAVIGAAFDVWMLIPDWNAGRSTNRQAGIAAVAEHIDHVCQLAGDSKHAGIGSDLDGGFGRERSPYDLDTIANLQFLATELAGRGYADADIADIMHKNWLSLLERAWS